MKRISTFSLMLAFVLNAAAQVTPITWQITFDPAADRGMDSLSGCWQIGDPGKTVFDTAWSAPNALVTDTVLPYPVAGISYAEFSAPIDFFGEEVEVAFSYRMEVDPGEAFGWVEYFDAGFTQSWVKADPWESWMGSFIDWSGDGLDTDSALIFTGTNNGWGSVLLSWRCLTVLQGPNDRASVTDSMRFRFAFQALANTNGRDGWMIDDLVVTNNGCIGGVQELAPIQLTVSPNPANDRVVLEFTNAPSGPTTLELFRADGAMVHREGMRGTRHVLDLPSLRDGPYVIRVTGEYGQLVHRLVIQH